jgi:hypothetical protein
MVVFAPIIHDHDTLDAVQMFLDRQWHDRISTHRVIRVDRDSTTVQGFNTAYRHADELGADWFVIGADDLVWGDGWLKEALFVASTYDAGVVGFNDGHTDISQYAPHFMVARFWAAGSNDWIIWPGFKSWWFDRDICLHRCGRPMMKIKGFMKNGE